MDMKQPYAHLNALRDKLRFKRDNARRERDRQNAICEAFEEAYQEVKLACDKQAKADADRDPAS